MCLMGRAYDMVLRGFVAGRTRLGLCMTGTTAGVTGNSHKIIYVDVHFSVFSAMNIQK